MGLFNFNTDVKEQNFETIRAGEYTLLLQSAVIKQSKTGNKMISVTYRVESDLEGNEDFKNSKIWDNMVLIPTCAWKIQDFCNASGYELPEGDVEMSDIEDMVAEMQGMLIDVETKVEEYTSNDGKPKERAVIKKFIPLVKDTKIDKL